MAHLLVGDGHFANRGGELQRWKTLLRAALDHGVREVSILGDFFELWLALPALMPAWQRAFVEPLFDVRHKGVRLRYVVGNKDYYIGRWNQEHGLFDEVADVQCRCTSPQGALHLAHGDLVNTADKQYRLWRAISRSAPVLWLGCHLPHKTMHRISKNLAAKLQQTNLEHKSYYPEAALRAEARRLKGDVIAAIYGHFHTHRHLIEDGVHIVTLPFLCTDTTGLWIDSHGARIFGVNGPDETYVFAGNEATTPAHASNMAF